MLNRSDTSSNRAEVAEIAQRLRGSCAFGAVAFSENTCFPSEVVRIESGYVDCLPLLNGGCWRDPASPDVAEALA